MKPSAPPTWGRGKLSIFILFVRFFFLACKTDQIFLSRRAPLFLFFLDPFDDLFSRAQAHWHFLPQSAHFGFSAETFMLSIFPSPVLGTKLFRRCPKTFRLAAELFGVVRRKLDNFATWSSQNIFISFSPSTTFLLHVTQAKKKTNREVRHLAFTSFYFFSTRAYLYFKRADRKNLNIRNVLRKTCSLSFGSNFLFFPNVWGKTHKLLYILERNVFKIQFFRLFFFAGTKNHFFDLY